MCSQLNCSEQLAPARPTLILQKAVDKSGCKDEAGAKRKPFVKVTGLLRFPV